MDKSLTAYHFEPLIQRLVSGGSSRRKAVSSFRELKRYFFLVRKYGRIGMVNGPVDVAWHQFILFTEEYADFCTKHFGHFMHHRPSVAGMAPVPGLIGHHEFRRLYHKEFMR